MKKLIPFALGAVLFVTAGTAMAQTSSSSDTSSTQKPAAMQVHVDHGWHWRGALFQNEELLSLLNMDADTLRQQLLSGKSLTEIASEKGISEQQIVDLFVKQGTQRIDEAVKAGKLTQEQADQLKSLLEERIKDGIEQKGGFKVKAGIKARFHKGKLEEAASVLGMNVEEILSELKSGKSIAQIAEEKGISKQQLIDDLLEKEKERITKWVDQTWNEEPGENQQNAEDSNL